ncbi:MAG: DUF2804 domain-containing protein [Termitinemataceae bacterium]|nr:MAG: DUF2804 domain-containing protein [Termitinemataceae bacterium]
MYSREILEQINSPIKNGKPLEGTWTSAFDKIDLSEIAKPYNVKLPQWMLKFRIKEWQSFVIQDKGFFLTALIANMKYFSFAELFFLDKESGEKISEFKIFPLSAWQATTNLKNSIINARTSGMSFHIHNWLDSSSVRLDINIEPSFYKIPFTAQLEFDMDKQNSVPLCVNLLYSESRCSYTYKAISAVRGRIVWGNRRIVLHRSKSSGLFCDNKGFYPYISNTNCCCAFGFDEKNRYLGFSLSDKTTKDANKNNENVLWVNGVLTLLPPVRITQTKDGGKTEWVIQDLEGMVDLTFKPIESFENKFAMFFSRFEHKVPVGFFYGALLDKDGQSIKLHDFFGMSENMNFRI